MKRIDLAFLIAGATAFCGGVGMGIYMGIAHNFQMAPVHAHLNLVGWTSLSLFGIVYRLFPELQERVLARIHLMLAAPTAFLFPIGIYLSIFHENPLLAIVTSLVWAVGCLLFLVQLIGLAVSGRSEAAPRPVPAVA